MSWEVAVEEIEVQEGHTARIDMMEAGPPRQIGREPTEAVLVLVESLSGIADAVEKLFIFGTGSGGERSDAPGSSAGVFSAWVRRAEGITVQFKARVTDSFRVTVLRLKNRFWKGLRQTPCDMCKTLAKNVVRLILAVNGFNVTGAGEVLQPLRDLDFEAFFEALRNAPIWSWLQETKLEVLVIGIIGPLAALLCVTRIIGDILYTEACRLVGACKDDGPGLAVT